MKVPNLFSHFNGMEHGAWSMEHGAWSMEQFENHECGLKGILND